ncbi:MAG: FprA family A-type flavoprotein [Desulfotomaculales bacterium]
MVLQPVAISSGITWVGVLDPALRVFDIIMETQHGTSYNSYLVRGSNGTALVETVKENFADEFLARLRAVVEPQLIDFVVCNHTEPDHTGALLRVLEAAPKATVLASETGVKFLRDMFSVDFPVRAVRDGEEVDLGGRTLRFIGAPFLHWPDSMFTYVPEDGVLFTCDVFGAHYADERLFDDAVGDFAGAQRYYFEVLFSPFRKHLLTALEKIQNLPLSVIAPSHGPVLRREPRQYVDRYTAWAREEAPSEKKRVVVLYVSSYGSTEKLARAIASGIGEAGVDVELINGRETTPLAVMHRVDAADGLVVGSPTFNGRAVSTIWWLLGLVTPIVNRGKPAAAFGSYGWSGEAAYQIEDFLKGIRFNIVQEPLRVRRKPSEEQLAAAAEFGRRFATSVLRAQAKKV